MNSVELNSAQQTCESPRSLAWIAHRDQFLPCRFARKHVAARPFDRGIERLVSQLTRAASRSLCR